MRVSQSPWGGRRLQQKVHSSDGGWSHALEVLTPGRGRNRDRLQLGRLVQTSIRHAAAASDRSVRAPRTSVIRQAVHDASFRNP